MVRFFLALLFSCLQVTGCSRSGYDIVVREAKQTLPPPAGEGFSSDTPWGSYAASLNVPECQTSPYPPLVVNTTAEELDDPSPQNPTLTDPAQAGPTLSIHEAVWISSKRSGASTITFDESLFPLSSPGRIEMEGLFAFPTSGNGPICIDGRSRGVVLSWPVNQTAFFLSCWPECLPAPTVPQFVMIGITFENAPEAFYVTGLPAQIAGCRFIGQPHMLFRLAVSGQTTVGPGNAFVFSDPVFAALEVFSAASNVLIIGNYFGVDPLTGATTSALDALRLKFDDIAVVEQNLLAGVEISTSDSSSHPGEAVVFRGNFTGVDRQGNLLPEEARHGVAFSTGGRPIIFGPDNRIEGVEGAAITVRSGSRVDLSANRITGNFQGVVFAGAPFTDPPVINETNRSSVSGTCPVAGRIDVFSDPEDQGADYLGSVDCDGVTAWLLETVVPPRRNVTATLTAAGSTSTFCDAVAVP